MQFDPLQRREFITLLGGAVVVWPLAARAQKPKVPRIGYLGYSSPRLEHHLVEALQQGLRKIGYVDGQNVAIEYRSAEGKLERLPALATELVGLNVDIIVTLATPGALAAKQATNTIPIVVAAMADPARDGLVASLSRPGGNVTGATFLGPELIPKRLGSQVVPAASRVTVLWHPGVPGENTNITEAIKSKARPLGRWYIRSRDQGQTRAGSPRAAPGTYQERMTADRLGDPASLLQQLPERQDHQGREPVGERT
jgi:ABC-type uncharacterized transport system substrate-binding protein